MAFEAQPRSKTVPEWWSDDRKDELARKVGQAVNAIMNGQTNNHFTVTLDPNKTTTTIPYAPARPGSSPVLTPLTASAAASAALVFAEPGTGEVVICHDSSAATDRRYALVIVG